MSVPNSLITQTTIVRELRTLLPHQLQEVLDFVRFLRQKRGATATPTYKNKAKKSLMDFAGQLKDSPNFNTDSHFERANT